MARKAQSETEKVLKIIGQILAERHDEVIGEHGEISAIKICDILDTEYNIKITRQTVSTYIKRDIERITPVEIKQNTSLILQSLNKSIQAMEQLAETTQNEKTKISATQAHFKGLEVKAKIVKILTDAQAQANAVNKINYVISFGDPHIVQREEETKEPFFKAGDGQDVLPVEEKKEKTEDEAKDESADG